MIGITFVVCVLMVALLIQGQKQGARKAYLQVVEGNTPARTMYEQLGFKKLYTYWFRVSPDYI